MTELLLDIRGVSKAFPGVQALDDVSIDLHPGEILGLCGENGAGKSTLMKILTGIYTPDAGQVFLDGELLEVAGPREAQERGLAIIHQELNLVPDLSVAQNIFIGREPRNMGFISDKALMRQAAEHLEKLNIDINPRALVRNLSVARQQMVEIASALSFDSRVLIMDEPTTALTDTEIETLFKLIQEFRTDRTGVIYISHRMSEIDEITDRVSVLRDGKYIDSLITQETEMREVISLMVGREIEDQHRHERKRGEEIVLEVEGLSTPDLLKDVSFTLRKSEILGFAGLMGAGRTETARALVGADERSSGTITVNNKQVTINHPADAVRHSIGYLSEDRKNLGLLLDHDVRSNVALASLYRYAGWHSLIDDRGVRGLANEYVSRLRVKTPSLNQVIRNLSGGNQQKVIIAKWLARDCDVLIFDEPTRGIDVGAKEEIYQLLDELVAQGKSIIMISSELPEVLRMSDRIVVMAEGRITGELDRDSANQQSIMELATAFQANQIGAA